MINVIKESTVRKMLPKRAPTSHKGENGRVMIIGGSLDYFGAPILAGLGALYSGADLVYLYVPECNFDVTRSMYPDFIVRSFSGEFLTPQAASKIIELGKNVDSVLIGPGLSDNEKTLEAAIDIVSHLRVPTVLDADAIPALKKIEKFPMEQQIVVTPHANEFENLVDRDIVVKEDDPKSIILLRSISMDLHINVLLKGHVDYISSYEGVVEKNITGNAGMTVGGTGDVLAGFVASLLAQRLEPFDAIRCAAFFAGKAGDLLKKQKGYCFSASDLAMTLPYVLR
ncbi:MAG: NAD(P)H-hydrate dehydratase [Candidatus Gracilibacteria bacterium]|jgi:NAD(P)H-hydrate epimerase